MYLALAAAIALEVLATLCLRASDGFRKKVWMAPVVIGYLASFYLLWLTLSLGLPVGIAYGVWTACGVALVAVLARVLFGERLTPTMGAGIALIVAGVLTIELAGLTLSAPASTMITSPATGTVSSPIRRLVQSAIRPTSGGEARKPIRSSHVTMVRPVPGRSPGS